MAHPLYKTYSQLLESVGESLLAELTRGLPHEQYLAKCGEFTMLERLIELPHILLNKVTELEDRTNARLDQQSKSDAARSATFVSTSFWDSYTDAR